MEALLVVGLSNEEAERVCQYANKQLGMIDTDSLSPTFLVDLVQNLHHVQTDPATAEASDPDAEIQGGNVEVEEWSPNKPYLMSGVVHPSQQRRRSSHEPFRPGSMDINHSTVCVDDTEVLLRHMPNLLVRREQLQRFLRLPKDLVPEGFYSTLKGLHKALQEILALPSTLKGLVWDETRRIRILMKRGGFVGYGFEEHVLYPEDLVPWETMAFGDDYLLSDPAFWKELKKLRIYWGDGDNGLECTREYVGEERDDEGNGMDIATWAQTWRQS